MCFFFFHAGSFSYTPNTIFTFIFHVYEDYVNLPSFKLHFQVLELQIKAGAEVGGLWWWGLGAVFSESVEEPTVKLGICSGTGV